MPNIKWKVDDIVELAGRNGKIVREHSDPGMFWVLWEYSGHESGEENLLEMSLFPEAKKLTPEPTCSKEFAEAMLDAHTAPLSVWLEWVKDHTAKEE